MRQIIKYLDRIEFVDERYYKFTNTKTNEELYYPSTTFILNSFPMDYGLLQWNRDVGNQAPEIAARAATSGSTVHHALSTLLNGYEISWDDKIYSLPEWQGIFRFMNFINAVNPQTIFNEKIIFSHEYQYAGTIDWLCKIDDKIWLIDFKFSNAIHDSYMLQLIAYKKAVEENNNIKIDKIGILHLKAKNKKGWKLAEPLHDYDKLFEIFLKTKALFNFTNPNCKPKNLVYPSSFSLANGGK